MKYELIVDGEWYAEGDLEWIIELAASFWDGPDIRILSENEFYGIEEDEA